MSEAERRKGYQFDRVLLETSRILTPQFDDTVVYLTGAQVEMLRNITQYLGRAETYVSEYAPGYYLTPTVGDLDDILAIVADLEEELMGNNNVPFGYYDRLAEQHFWVKSGAGTHLASLLTVPEGYVYVIKATMSINRDKIVTQHHLVKDGITYYSIKSFTDQPVSAWAINDNVDYALKEGDELWFQYLACDDGDYIEATAWGYKMQVPA